MRSKLKSWEESDGSVHEEKDKKMDSKLKYTMSESDCEILEHKIEEIRSPFGTIKMIGAIVFLIFIILALYEYIKNDYLELHKIIIFCLMFLIIIGLNNYIFRLRTRAHFKDLKIKKKVSEYLMVTDKYVNRYGTFTTGKHFGVGSSVGFYIIFSTKKLQVDETIYQEIEIGDKVKVNICLLLKGSFKSYCPTIYRR